MIYDNKNRKGHPPTEQKGISNERIGFHPTDGEPDAIDISVGYAPKEETPLTHGFWICPLSAGTIKVRLLGQKGTDRDFIIQEARVQAFQGIWLEEKCYEIIADGTTVTSASIAW